MIDKLSGEFQRRYEPNYHWQHAVSATLNLPGLRGCWPMSSFNEAGNAYDVGGQNRILTRNGSPTYSYDNLVPYIDCNGTTDYLARADEAGLDIIGTEAYVNPTERGLTLGGWINYDVTNNQRPFMAKFGALIGDRAYMIDVNNGTARFLLGTGAALTIYLGSTVTADEWTYFVGRWIPSNNADIFINDTKTTNASVIAALGNSTSDLRIGADSDNPNFSDARISICFLCTMQLSDAIILSHFHQTRAAYGV